MKTTGNVAAASKVRFCWNAPHITRTRDRVGGESKNGETKNTISWRDDA